MKTVILNIALIFSIFISPNAFASLSVHPKQIVATVVYGQMNSISFHISNIGPSSSMSYQLSSNDSWIGFNSTYGNININDSVNIILYIDATQLKQGIYKTNITINDPHHGPFTIPLEILVSVSTDVYESSENNSLKLLAFPNPFNSITEISYTLPKSQPVIIKLLDIQGNYIQTVADEFQSEGNHRIKYDVSDLPSGIYFLALNTSIYSIVRKLIINK